MTVPDESRMTVRQRRARLQSMAQRLFAGGWQPLAANRSGDIIRGFEAFDVLLERHPDLGRVRFVALLGPSRLR